jgi:hypothetical protein
MTCRVPLKALALLPLTALLARAEPRELPGPEYRKLHAELTAREPWQTIPWRLSLLEARADAAREKKPVYLLVRSGHPLGCV